MRKQDPITIALVDALERKNKTLNETIAAKDAEIGRLRGFIADYAEHDIQCPANEVGEVPGELGECACGFTADLAALDAKGGG